MTKNYAYALIIRKDKILVLQRPEHKKIHPNYWNFAGGKIEAGETVIQAIIREVKEETNTAFTPILNAGIFTDEHEITKEPLKVYVILGKIKGRIKLNNEHKSHKWVSIDEIRQMQVIPYIEKMFKMEE